MIQAIRQNVVNAILLVAVLLFGSTASLTHFHASHSLDYTASQLGEGAHHDCPTCALRSTISAGAVFNAPFELLLNTEFVSIASTASELFSTNAPLKPYSQAPPA